MVRLILRGRSNPSPRPPFFGQLAADALDEVVAGDRAAAFGDGGEADAADDVHDRAAGELVVSCKRFQVDVGGEAGFI